MIDLRGEILVWIGKALLWVVGIFLLFLLASLHGCASKTPCAMTVPKYVWIQECTQLRGLGSVCKPVQVETEHCIVYEETTNENT